MIRLALLRHGVTAWNRQHLIQGRTDIPLEPDAERDLLQQRLPEDWLDVDCVSSPLVRAKRTAEILTGQQTVVASELIEMDWGEWEGQRNIDLYAQPDSGFRHLHDWGWYYRAPGGESPADVRCRIEPWVKGLQRDTLVVTHIGVMRVLLALAYQWSFQGEPPFAIKRNRLYVLHVSDTITVGEPACVRLLPAA